MNSDTVTPLLCTIPLAKNVDPYKTMFLEKLLSAKMCRAFGPCVSSRYTTAVEPETTMLKLSILQVQATLGTDPQLDA